jgi:Lipocalin-like domain
MRKLVWSSVGLLMSTIAVVSSAALPGNQDHPVNQSIQAQLIGAWRLAWLEEQGADGKPLKANRTGMLVYTSDGHMSVQIMASESAAPLAAGPVQYEQGGYEGYYGRYDVDERTHSVTHHVEGALVRTLIGHDLTRVYSFSGKQLILKSSRPDEHWTIAWEHY